MLRRTLFRLNSLDPYVNLAIENWLMEAKPKNDIYLLLWRDSPCVVIGRHQDPTRECNLALMREMAIPLVRRYSGGGAVYQDLGNSNYSYITDLELFDRQKACELVKSAMARLNVELRVSERSDLWMGEGKVSGSAFRLSHGKAYHHGTMLRNTCLETLQRLLDSIFTTEDTHKYSVASVKSPVKNTKISHEEFLRSMEEQFEPHSWEEINELPKEATAYYEELKDPSWIYERKQLAKNVL